METLTPLAQAAWLLQVNKSTDDDAKEITEKCTELNPVQVLYILCGFDIEKLLLNTKILSFRLSKF